MRPRPVLTANAVSGAVTGVALLLTFLGYSNAAGNLSGEAQGIGGAVAFLVPLVGNLIAALHSQGKVTPLADPVTESGTPLIPATRRPSPGITGTAAPQNVVNVYRVTAPSSEPIVVPEMG